MQFLILDLNLKPIRIVDEFNSALWVPRYTEFGDCELYVPATEENLQIYRKNFYIARPDDEMVCVIKKIEIDSDPDEGNHLIVTGEDVRRFLDQRIIWKTATNNGPVEDFLRGLVSDSMIAPKDSNRRMKKANGSNLIGLGDLAGFEAASTEQVSYKPVGEKIRETCQAYKWGSRMRLENEKLLFELYAGTDRSGNVKFSASLENLESNSYSDDETNLGNVALIGGEGEGAERVMESYGSSVGIYRSEKFVDAKSISKQISFEALQQTFPGGTIVNQSGYKYKVATIRISVVDEDHAQWLLAAIPGSILVTIDGAQYVEASDVIVADIPSAQPKTSDSCTLNELIYKTYLINAGAEALSQFGEVVSFSGEIVPNQTFVYKKDYFLGDIVSVETELGIRADARIVEMMESEDATGYHAEPVLEYINVYAIPDERENLATEDLIVITTENLEPLATEGEQE